MLREKTSFAPARAGHTPSIGRCDGGAPTPLSTVDCAEAFRREGGVWKLVHSHADMLGKAG
jgi:hypothetical protein